MNYREVAEAVKEGKALALTRLGDGEARILNYPNDKKAATWMMNKHLGYVPDHDDIMEIRHNLMLAFRNSDIIGVPTEKHKKLNDKYWSEAEEMMHTLVPQTKGKHRCSIDIHTDWLENDIYSELLQDKNDVYVISCRDIGKALEKKYNIGKVHQHFIDPQMSFEGKSRPSKHFPVQFNQIDEWIGNMDLHGEICLVGAGFIGKIYTTWFCDMGGVGLDVGHVPDKWYGMVTRGVGGKVGVKSDKHKL